MTITRTATAAIPPPTIIIRVSTGMSPTGVVGSPFDVVVVEEVEVDVGYVDSVL